VNTFSRNTTAKACAEIVTPTNKIRKNKLKIKEFKKTVKGH